MNKKCENKYENTRKTDITTNVSENPSAEKHKTKASKNATHEKPINTAFTAVKDHFLDVNCSYVAADEIDPGFLQKRNSEITIFQSNIRSLNANFDRIHEIFHNENTPDILAFTETWLKEESYVPEIEGYCFEHINSQKTKNCAGGVGVYISNDINYEKQSDLYLNYENCEDLWIKISSKNKKRDKKSDGLVLGVIYRHPGHNHKQFSKNLCNTLEILNSRKQNYVIVGDINLDSQKYNVASNITEYINLLNSLGCNLFVDKPTRISGSSSSCIDHVYSNLAVDSIESQILCTDISDHFSIISKVDFAVNRKKYEPVIYRRKQS